MEARAKDPSNLAVTGVTFRQQGQQKRVQFLVWGARKGLPLCEGFPRFLLTLGHKSNKPVSALGIPVDSFKG